MIRFYRRLAHASKFWASAAQTRETSGIQIMMSRKRLALARGQPLPRHITRHMCDEWARVGDAEVLAGLYFRAALIEIAAPEVRLGP
jgi:hypothetical protein